MRRLFLILGLVLGAVVAIGLFLFFRASQPVYTEIPVAINDIPAGSTISASMFRVARWADVDARSRAAYITVAEFGQADGKVLTSDVRAGFPIAKAQIDPNAPTGIEQRLSLAVEGNAYYIALPVTPDEVGNYVQPGDRVDITLAIGQIAARELVYVRQPDGPVIPPPAGEPVTLSLSLPAAKLILQALPVLRVERDAPRAATTTTTGQQQNQSSQPYRPGDVKRVYVQVTRDQLEVLSFALNNGARNIAVRAAGADGDVTPTEGVTWSDFIKWFYAQRGNATDAASPFSGAGPYESHESPRR